MTPSATDPSVNQDTNSLFNELEKDLLDHIINSMQNRKISIEDAQKLAQEFLALLPANDKKDLLNKLNVIAQKFPEARQTYTKYAAHNEKEERQKALQEMSQHIKTGNIEQAISVAKGANQ